MNSNKNDVPKHFQNMVVQALIDLTLYNKETDGQVDLQMLLGQLYSDFKAKLAFINVQDKSFKGLSSVIFVVSVGLFTYGDIDKVWDILEYKPTRSNVRILAGCIRALTPLPNELDARDDQFKKQVIDWFSKNASKLVWDVDERRYKFSQFE